LKLPALPGESDSRGPAFLLDEFRGCLSYERIPRFGPKRLAEVRLDRRQRAVFERFVVQLLERGSRFRRLSGVEQASRLLVTRDVTQAGGVLEHLPRRAHVPAKPRIARTIVERDQGGQAEEIGSILPNEPERPLLSCLLAD